MQKHISPERMPPVNTEYRSNNANKAAGKGRFKGPENSILKISTAIRHRAGPLNFIAKDLKAIKWLVG